MEVCACAWGHHFQIWRSAAQYTDQLNVIVFKPAGVQSADSASRTERLTETDAAELDVEEAKSTGSRGRSAGLAGPGFGPTIILKRFTPVRYKCGHAIYSTDVFSWCDCCVGADSAREKFGNSGVRSMVKRLRGRLLWSKSLCGPMLLADASTRSAIANRPAPDGTFRKEGSIYAGILPAQFTPSDTAIDWNRQSWSMVLLPLPDDPFTRLTLLAHESFHRVQPGLGLSASDAPDPALDTEAGRLWMRMELRALARALRSPPSSGCQSAIDAMLFRTYRDQLCPGTEKMEAAMEKQEGLAEYTGGLYRIARNRREHKSRSTCCGGL
jgi:hypothetical protein